MKALFTRRLGAVTLLSLSSGLPLGLVITALPAWLAVANVDIKTIGLLTLTQLPYGFKFVWSPLLDRARPPFLTGRRGWILFCQLALAAVVGALAWLAGGLTTCATPDACKGLAAPSPEIVTAIAALSFLISFASASQDIVYDAYAVEVLEKHEHGTAVGARSAVYRAGLWLSGNIAITLGPLWGWQWTLALQAIIYLALLPVTLFAPEPPRIEGQPQTLRDAVWLPFVGMLGRPRALEIISFVLLYRLADSIAGALVSPFLLQQGFSAFDVGVVRGGVGVAGTLAGTIIGGLLTARIGVGRSLWICGVLQIVSNVGYAVIAEIPVTLGLVRVTSPFNTLGAAIFSALVLGGAAVWLARNGLRLGAAVLLLICVAIGWASGALPWLTSFDLTFSLPLQSAIFIETLTGGMGWGAFGVLLLRLTDKRFPATQYALFSSLVGLARTFVGPPAGVMADALGWRDFFLLTMAFGVPGMVMLQRFVPWGQEPKEVSGEAVEPLPPGAPWSTQALLTRGLVAGLATGVASLLLSISLVAIKGWRETKVFDFTSATRKVLLPADWMQGIDLVNALVFALMGGVAVAAYLAARGKPDVAVRV